MDLCNIKDYCGAALVSGRPSIIVNSSDSGYFSGFFVDPCGFSNRSAAFTAAGTFDVLSVSLVTDRNDLQTFFNLLQAYESDMSDPEAEQAWKDFSYDHPTVIDDMNSIRAFIETMGGKS
ncbi:MAG: hypothetical protein IKO41_13430 [Lachnospiraceae bacterium]|nr:hypothetical protein [Lachnospiraceae bacterium]